MAIKTIKLIEPKKKRKRLPVKKKITGQPRIPSLVDSKGFCMIGEEKEIHVIEDADGNIISQTINGIEVGTGW